VPQNIIRFIAGIVIGTIGSGLFFFVLGPGRTGPLDGLAAANAGRTDELVAGLRGTIEEQRTVIGVLESENNRLKEYIRDAGGISHTLTGTVTTSGTYTASAIEVSKKLRAGIEALEDWYYRLRSEYPGLVDLEFE
jgi:hypothetical protein